MDAAGVMCVVADDHPALRRGLVSYLRQEAGLTVVGEAETTERALELAERRAADVLLIDAHLGAVGAVEACRVLARGGARTRVVIYTVDEDVRLLEEALDAGAAGFVLKSGPLAEVARAIRFVAEGRAYVDASLVAALLRRRAVRAASPLSARESQVLELLTRGCTTDEVAHELFLSPATVRTYVEQAMHKLDARNRAHLVAKALQRGLVEAPRAASPAGGP